MEGFSWRGTLEGVPWSGITGEASIRGPLEGDFGSDPLRGPCSDPV
jgi:hypothetical protein